MSNDDYDKIMQETVDPLIVQNWLDCMKGGGIKGNIDVNDDQVLFTLEWRGFAGVNSVTVNGKPHVTGVKCDDSLIVSGSVLTSNVPTTDVCTRIGKSAVTYVVNTTGGSKVLQLSAQSDHAKNPPPQQGGQPPIWNKGGAQVVEAHLTSRDAWNSMDCCNEFKGWIIVPQPGVAASTYGYWRASFYYPKSNPQHGMAGFMKGSWQPGDRLEFDIPVPKNAMDPFAGNDIHICIGAIENGPCMQTPNLLTLPIE